MTNGVAWNLYHLEFEEGIEYEHVFMIDFASDPVDKAANMLCLLHRQSISKGEHEQFWQRHLALSPESIGKVLFIEETLRFLRRQLRKSEGMLFDIEDLAESMHNMFSTEARERIGPLKIRKRKPKIKRVAQDVVIEGVPTCNESASADEQGQN